MDRKNLMRDVVYVEKPDGSRIGPFKTTVVQGKANIYDAQLDVNDGEFLVRPLPNGKEERYLIESSEYSPGLHTIPPHFALKLHKATAVQPLMPRNTTVSIINSTGIQVGDHNVTNINHALNELAQRIEDSQASPNDKAEAKSRFSSLLAHPLVNSILGGIAGGLAGGAGG